MQLRWSLVIASLATLFTSATAGAFSVAPLHWQAIVVPGKEQLITVTVENNESAAGTFVASIGGVKQNEKGQPVFGAHFDEVEQWLTVPSTDIQLAPKEKKKIIVSARPPVFAEPGTHYAAVIIKKKSSQSGTVGIAGQTAVILEINIAGTVREGLSINDWSVKKTIATKAAWTTVAELQNTGTMSLPLAGKVTITNWRGHDVAQQPLSLGNTLLPGTKRALTPEVSGRFFWPGPYRADIIIEYGRSHMVARATQTIWYIPSWSIGVALVLIIICVLALHLKKRAASLHV